MAQVAVSCYNCGPYLRLASGHVCRPASSIASSHMFVLTHPREHDEDDVAV